MLVKESRNIQNIIIGYTYIIVGKVICIGIHTSDVVTMVRSAGIYCTVGVHKHLLTIKFIEDGIFCSYHLLLKINFPL